MNNEIAAELHKNIAQRKLLKIAEALGVRCEPIRGTGEMKFMHHNFGRIYKINTRRNDSPQNLISALRQLANGCSTQERRHAV